MHSTCSQDPRRRRLVARCAATASAIVLGASALVASTSGAAVRPTSAHPVGVEIEAHTGPYGPQLIVGNGPLKGFSVYAITSDTATTFGCATALFHGPGGSVFPCTGPATSQQAEWPALTTPVAPIAGPGVTKSLLSTVDRKGVGHQVVYDGHPLYLFDMSPYSVTGEGWDEPSLPPWHGTWWLVNPDGTYQEWSQTLTATQLADGTTALAAIMLTGDGWHEFPLYAFSADTDAVSNCGVNCSRVFEPLLTTGEPGIEGAGVSGTIGTITRTDGTTQVTYDGHPLYLYADEGITPTAGGSLVATGSGEGKTVGSGTFQLVTP